MRAAEIIGAVATILGIIVVMGKGLRGLLTAFHNENVAPSIAAVTVAIAHNTEATASLTAAMAKSNESNERGFERLGDIIADHEDRISLLERPPRPIKSARIRKAS